MALGGTESGKAVATGTRAGTWVAASGDTVGDGVTVDSAAEMVGTEVRGTGVGKAELIGVSVGVKVATAASGVVSGMDGVPAGEAFCCTTLE